MTKEELVKFYKKKLGPRRKMGFFTFIMCWIFSIALMVVGTNYEEKRWRKSQEYYFQYKDNLTIAPILPREIKEIIPKKNDPKIESKIAEKKAPMENNLTFMGTGEEDKKATKAIKKTDPKKVETEKKLTLFEKLKNIEKEKKELEKDIFDRYSKEVDVTDSSNYGYLSLNIKGFPLSNTLTGGLGLEVYDKDKKYLFTFYTDHFWHQSGSDDGGYWQEKRLYDSMTLKFPYNGKYYFLAGVLPGPNQQKLFDAYTNFSDGKVVMKIECPRNIYIPISYDDYFMPWVLAFFVIGFIVLRQTLKPDIKLKRVVDEKFDFQNYYYIAKSKKKGLSLGDSLYFVNGSSKKKGSASVGELLLEKDGVQYYLEVEREKEEGIFYYYAYLYGDIDKNKFMKIPSEKSFKFNGKEFLLENRSKKRKTVHYSYHNGIKEDVLKYFVNFGTRNEQEYLSFEYTEDPTDFDQVYGKAIELYSLSIWRVKK